MTLPRSKKNQNLPDKIVYVKDLKGASHPVSFTTISAPHPALKDYFCYCLLKASQQSKIGLEQAFSPFQFQTIHFVIMSIIEQENAPSQNQVAEKIGIDKASMVKLVDHLESLNAVERINDSKDRRCKLLHLTTLGEKLLSQGKEAAKSAEKELLKAFSKEEQVLFKQLLSKLLI